jgi:site-specific DNA-methyltransferase (adenine-specific)
MMAKTLYYGDNLKVLRESIRDESVDLIYLDPPFNSNADYNVIFRDHQTGAPQAQVNAFKDTWQWGEETAVAFHELEKSHGDLAELMDLLVRALGKNKLSAYLIMMAARIVELHRVLKPTGSFYLHCDPTASHYLKVLLDNVFQPKNFRNEIVWAYRGGGRPKKDFGKKHDIILRYTKTADYCFNADSIRIPYQAEGKGRTDDAMWGKHKGSDKVYKPHLLGKVPEDWWPMDALNANSPERLGYPTQKPLALLERIINASSSPGDIVLDPFCGCGTAVSAAEKLEREWLGIDITHLAVSLIQARLTRDHGLISGQDYLLEGTPEDLASARFLFESEPEGPYQFQFWVLGLIGAQAYGAGSEKGKGKKGGDTGIDGRLFFRTPNGERLEKAIVSVKGGKHLNPGMIRDLKGTVQREKAKFGIFVTLESPTRGMVEEAAQSEMYYYGNELMPSIQLLTVEQLLGGQRPRIPIGSLNVSYEQKPVATLEAVAKRRGATPLFPDQ